VTFLPSMAGNEKSAIVSLVMAAVAGAEARKGRVSATESYDSSSVSRGRHLAKMCIYKRNRA